MHMNTGMKKSLLALAVSCGTLASTELLAADNPLAGLQIESFSYSAGQLTLTPVGGTAFTVPIVGAGDTGGGDTGGGDTGGGDTGGGDTGGGDTGGGDTGGGSTACGTGGIVCEYNVPAGQATSGQMYYVVQIPGNGILASSFTTRSAQYATLASFDYSVPSGTAVPSIHMWISAEPGGEPLSSGCASFGAVANGASLDFLTRSYRNYCALAPSTQYYFNTRLATPSAGTFYLTRHYWPR